MYLIKQVQKDGNTRGDNVDKSASGLFLRYNQNTCGVQVYILC